jgi:hypothetical protein
MATGVNKSTILRSIKVGRISATKNDAGWTIEAPCFPVFADGRNRRGTAMPRDATVDELIRVLRQQVEDMRQERDRWHATCQSAAVHPASATSRNRQWRGKQRGKQPRQPMAARLALDAKDGLMARRVLLPVNEFQGSSMIHRNPALRPCRR